MSFFAKLMGNRRRAQVGLGGGAPGPAHGHGQGGRGRQRQLHRRLERPRCENHSLKNTFSKKEKNVPDFDIDVCVTLRAAADYPRRATLDSVVTITSDSR